MGGRREAVVRWGTWEELVLGGAVLRHGTKAWDTVASEVRARAPSSTSTLYALPFTPKECEAKYEDLLERYCGCTAWFEDLRKQRVAELKRELEISEESIGSLQSKLESLISERVGKSNSNCDMDSTPPTQNIEVECPVKQISKDGLSAGSFTEDMMRDCSMPETQVLAERQMEENEMKVGASQIERDRAAAPHNMEAGRLGVKKKRGKRRRKGNVDQKEGGESDMLSSVNADKEKEASSEGCNEAVANSHQSSGLCDGKEVADLAGIMNLFIARDDQSVFRRLETQKRARYKKMIRRHVDFGTIQASIDDGAISTTRELYRDLLLLSNNVLLFYPKSCAEYKAALTIRDAATRRFHHTSPKDSCHDSTPSITGAFQDSTSHSLNRGLLAAAESMRNPVKPRSVRPCNRKVSGKAVPKAAISSRTPSAKGSNGELPSGGGGLTVKSTAESMAAAVARKGIGRPSKRGQEATQKTPDVPVQGRKRARRR